MNNIMNGELDQLLYFWKDNLFVEKRSCYSYGSRLEVSTQLAGRP